LPAPSHTHTRDRGRPPDASRPSVTKRCPCAAPGHSDLASEDFPLWPGCAVGRTATVAPPVVAGRSWVELRSSASVGVRARRCRRLCRPAARRAPPRAASPQTATSRRPGPHLACRLLLMSLSVRAHVAGRHRGTTRETESRPPPRSPAADRHTQGRASPRDPGDRGRRTNHPAGPDPVLVIIQCEYKTE